MKSNSGERLNAWFNRQPLWVVITLLVVLLGFIGSVNTISEQLVNAYRSHIGWKSVEQAKIDKLSPLETFSYVNSLLGQPILEHAKTIGGRYTKFTYRERGYWVVAYVDSSNIVQIMAITACGNDSFYPKISNIPFGKSIILSRSYMKDGVEANNEGRFYFVQQATQPSFFYDTQYGANPGRYQTASTGNNQYCGAVVLPSDLRQKIESNKTLSLADINELRAKILINTYVVTSPGVDLPSDDIDYAAISVDKEDAGILAPPPVLTSDEQKLLTNRWNNAKPYTVIKNSNM